MCRALDFQRHPDAQQIRLPNVIHAVAIIESLRSESTFLILSTFIFLFTKAAPVARARSEQVIRSG